MQPNNSLNHVPALRSGQPISKNWSEQYDRLCSMRQTPVTLTEYINGARRPQDELQRKKTGLREFRPGLTQTELYKHRRLESGTFKLRKYRNCTIRVAKTKALISFAVTAKLICAFVFA